MLRAYMKISMSVVLLQSKTLTRHALHRDHENHTPLTQISKFNEETSVLFKIVNILHNSDLHLQKFDSTEIQRHTVLGMSIFEQWDLTGCELNAPYGAPHCHPRGGDLGTCAGCTECQGTRGHARKR